MAQSFNFAKFDDDSERKQDKSEEIPNPAPQGLLEKYSGYFDVNSQTVLQRVKKTLWPFDRSKFFENKADLYGAVWVPATLIFLLSLCGSVSARLTADEGYSFNPSVLITISTLVYFFILVVPAVLSFFLLPIEEVSFIELLSLYGYSYFIFCPAAIICTLNFQFLRWGVFIASSVWAGVLLTKNYYNQINASEGWKKYLTILISLSGYVVLTLTTNIYLFN